ncbi:hypothetical protein GCM10020331_042410 [Ectobacillus funiculus]
MSKKGEPLVTVYANSEHVEEVKRKLYESIRISKEAVVSPVLVYDIVGE